MAGSPDPKPVGRIKDPHALRAARLASDECAACGGPPSNVHHLIERSLGGDDEPGNLIILCGTGSSGCHGAFHGSTYTHIPRMVPVFSNGSVEAVGAEQPLAERRDSEWVRRRIGWTIAARPDIIAYVMGKLGDTAGAEFLRRQYYLEPVVL